MGSRSSPWFPVDGDPRRVGGEIPTTRQLPSVTQRRPPRATPILGMIPKLQRGMQLLEAPSRLQSEQTLVGLA